MRTISQAARIKWRSVIIGRLLAMRNEGRITFLRIEDRRVVTRFRASGMVRELHLSAAGRLVGVPGLKRFSLEMER